MSKVRELNLEKAAVELNLGRVIIYPTETFYALGCLATNDQALEEIFKLKKRDAHKPLPIIIADRAMAGQFLRLNSAEAHLAQLFWPGPLSIVTEVASSISSLACDWRGRCAVRWTPHPTAQKLCWAAGVPLVASSANFSGQQPVSDFKKLDQLLVQKIPVVQAALKPQGGLPSTLVEIKADGVLQVLRAGAITKDQLMSAGYTLC